jgi:tripeptide aminopeptidase
VSIDSSAAFQAVMRLASQTAIHRAFQWLHLQEPRIRVWHQAVASIPAPPFGEAERAAWMADRFRELNLDTVSVDECGNVQGWLRAPGGSGQGACVLLAAHLDTVFPAADFYPPVEQDGRLQGPGVSDNSAGLTALLAIAACLQQSDIAPPADILFTGTVGEEGEGNLRGMRYMFDACPAAPRIRTAIVLDGAGTETIVNQGIGSRRFSVTITGPGGHSWAEADRPNPILMLAQGLALLEQRVEPATPRTTWSVGRMEGGASVNAIPQSANARLDTRSLDPGQLDALEAALRQSFEQAVAERVQQAAAAGVACGAVRCQIECIGERPAAALAEDAPLLTIARSVDRHLGIRSSIRAASTDANIPLARGVPAISIGGGGSGGGVHTLQEWFDPAGRELALRRILLLLLAVAGELE